LLSKERKAKRKQKKTEKGSLQKKKGGSKNGAMKKRLPNKDGQEA